MSSAIDEARMVPASENDVINPGSFYFACLNLQRKTDPESYWIVLRAPREWLPDGFFDTRPVQARVFPFWIVGKDQRVWLPRSSLFYLDRSQREMFPERAKRLDFGNTLILIDSFQNTDAALIHFNRRITDSTNRYNERRERLDRNLTSTQRGRSLSVFMDDFLDEGVNEDASTVRRTTVGADIVHDSDVVHNSPGPAKRQRREGTVSSKSSPKHEGKGKTQINKPRIKTEKEERHFALADTIMSDSRVRIYVGCSNKEYLADASVLQQSSPVLHSLVCTNDESEGSFIMHPKLREIDTDDFLAVLEFMQTGEYDPAIISNPDGNDAGPMALDGRLTVEDYSESLVQAGRLYLLAKTFRIKGMTELIIRKITRAQYKRYSNLALIEFGRIVLTRPVQDTGRTTGVFVFEHLERWAITQLAENFMHIMRSEIEHNKYLALIDDTTDRNVHALVLEQAASNYRQLGGLPELIEDSD